MSIFGKAKTGFWVLLVAALGAIAKRIVDAVVTLNIERATEKVGADDEIAERIGWINSMTDFIIQTALPFFQSILKYITGPFAWSFVAGALFVGFSDWIWFVLSRPYSWLKSWHARNKTGLVPLRIKENNFSTKELHQDGKRINLSHAVGTIAGFQPPLASVLVQSGYADYYVFWDEWNHNKYQKLCRGIEFKAYDIFPNEGNIEALEQPSKP